LNALAALEIQLLELVSRNSTMAVDCCRTN